MIKGEQVSMLPKTYIAKIKESIRYIFTVAGTLISALRKNIVEQCLFSTVIWFMFYLDYQVLFPNLQAKTYLFYLYCHPYIVALE